MVVVGDEAVVRLTRESPSLANRAVSNRAVLL